MKMKKLMAMLLMGTIILGSLTACSNSDSKAEDSKAEDSKTDGSKAEDSKVEEESTEEMVTVKMIVRSGPTDEDEMVMEEVNRLLAEKVGVQLEIEFIDGGEYDVRAQNMITAGEDFDIMFTCSWSNDLMANIAKGALMPLNDLMETEWGQMIKDELPEWTFPALTVDGNLYAISSSKNFAFQYGLFIQADLADEYGLDLDSIYSVRDVEPFMEWLVENHPEYIPMDEGNQLQACLRPMHDNFSENFVNFNEPDTVYAYQDYEVIEENFEMLNEWYKKGYLRSDLLTVTDNSPEVQANKYVMYVNDYEPGIEVSVSSGRGVDYYCVPLQEPYIQAACGRGSTLAINVNSTKGEAAIKVLAMLFTDEEVMNTLVFGIEGVHYTKVDENRIEQMTNEDGSLKYNRVGTAWSIGNPRLLYLLPGQSDDLYEQYDELFESAQVSPYLGFSFDTSAVDTEIAQMSAVRSEYYKQLCCADDFEATWQEFADATIAAGSNIVKEELESQIAEWKAAN